MEILTKRRDALEKALKTLEHSLKKLESKEFSDYEELRDSIIQRFEYSTDTFWKFLKDYLTSVLKVQVDVARPKTVFKECFEVKIFSAKEFELSVNLIEDRNLTSHGYNENLAEEICGKIPQYFTLMQTVVNRLAQDVYSKH